MKGQAWIIVVILIVVVAALVFFLPGLIRPGITTIAGVGPGTQGVIIASFVPEIDSIEQPETDQIEVSYIIKIKNLGESNANKVTAKIVGGLGKDKIAEGINDITLAGVDPTKKLAGEEAIGTFEGIKPPTSKETEQSYPSTARVTYSYTTSSEVLLRVANSAYFKLTPKMQTGIVSSKTSSGPFSVTSLVRSAIIPATSGTVKLTVTIENIGGGIPYITSLTDSKIKITVKPEAVTGVTVSGTYCSSTPTEVKLLQAKSKTFTCTVSLTGVDTYTDVPLKIELNYNYFVDSTTSITVLKKIV